MTKFQNVLTGEIKEFTIGEDIFYSPRIEGGFKTPKIIEAYFDEEQNEYRMIRTYLFGFPTVVFGDYNIRDPKKNNLTEDCSYISIGDVHSVIKDEALHYGEIFGHYHQDKKLIPSVQIHNEIDNDFIALNIKMPMKSFGVDIRALGTSIDKINNSNKKEMVYLDSFSSAFKK